MKKWLQEHLICPECLDSKTALTLEIQEEHNDDILEGTLNCPGCGSRYLIQEGVAVIVPQKTLPHTKGHTTYNSQSMMSAYLWSHYSEFFNGPDATDAYRKWASYFKQTDGWALDIGCSVGRLSFELSKTHTYVIGVDTSLSFIKKARQLLSDKNLEFDLIVEGHITEERECELDPEYDYNATEFIVADALALPFRSDLFATAASVNILEKLPDPIQHLKEVNRILQKEQANFLFSDPFSWDESVSSPDLWISGRNKGPGKGRGMDNICQLIKVENNVFDPGFIIQEKGDVLWKIRKTQNLWEHITSQFVIGKRD
ncbi:class I SAM-dependent methyltransferase [Desulfobacula phenolica]|uniref:Methyltransferase domain-containing protein n=1 Tax=Desulfobacula phenolica TaxID=90732 RepID=A0A1H2DMM6_9BACT|nr:methyltransferase domain-containing protein [Desulfobacula phenolica]SDT83984.1 Methyltransferase domain-containing protein [Desulfobacula phenolica]